MIEYNNYISMNSGNKVYLHDLTDNHYSIVDIAHALSNQCRYNGSCDVFYSVAQHSVLCSQMAPKEIALEALCHDIAEAVTSDIPRPVKELLPDFRKFEKMVERDMFYKLGLDYSVMDQVYEVDNKMLVTEGLQIMKNVDVTKDWGEIGLMEPYKIHIDSWRPTHAKDLFLDRYYYLLERRSVQSSLNEDELEVEIN